MYYDVLCMYGMFLYAAELQSMEVSQNVKLKNPMVNGLVEGKILTGNHRFSHDSYGTFL